MKALIITADDFGLLKSLNEGIAMAYAEGIVSYINLMPSGEAFEDAIARLRQLAPKEIGVHLSLTETKPVSDPKTVPSLVDAKGMLPGDYPALFLGILSKKINIGHINIELRNQLDKMKSLAIPITALSTHEHVHMMPAITQMFIALAKEYKIPAIRYFSSDKPVKPITPKKLYKMLVLSCLGRVGNKNMARSGLAHTDHFLGFYDSGILNENILLSMMSILEDGSTELACHPGFLSPEILESFRFHINCEAELYGLTSRRVKNAVKENGITITTFGALFAPKT